MVGRARRAIVGRFREEIVVFGCHSDGDEIRGNSMSRTIAEKPKVCVRVGEGGSVREEMKVFNLRNRPRRMVLPLI